MSVPKRENNLILDSDGMVLLCSICGDVASGINYGVYSCKSCKNFFCNRFQPGNPAPLPCTNNQKCSMSPINLKNCPDCRLKKFVAVGMSKSCRTIRIPEQKTEIQGATQKANVSSQEKDHLDAILDDEAGIVTTIFKAHLDTCDYTKLVGRSQPIYTQRPPQVACLLNPAIHIIGNGDFHDLENFLKRFEPAISGVVEFAMRIPGFRLLSQEDQMTLIKASFFEVLVVRFACMIDCKANLRINLYSLRGRSLHVAERIKALNLSETEISLFCVVVVMTYRRGLRNAYFVREVQKKIINILQKIVTVTHQENPYFLKDLMEKHSDLITLNNEHSRQLLTYKIEPRSTGCCSNRRNC